MALPSSIMQAMRLIREGKLADAADLIRKSLSDGSALGQVAPSSHKTEATASGFTAARYTGPTGTLPYMLYVPANRITNMGVIVMLHGCTQSPEDFARGTRMNALADEFGCVVVYPGQTQTANAQKCWNWFRPADQHRDSGEPALIAGITRQVMAAQQIDPAQVYVAGLSAGGAAAAIMADAYPDIFAAVGIHSGLACGAARDLTSALSAMKRGSGGAQTGKSTQRFVPVITFHGDRDTTVDEINAREIIAAAVAAAGPLTATTQHDSSAGGRHYTRTLHSNAAGRALVEQWTIHGGGHAWSGGAAAGSYTDPAGPDASRAILNFFFATRLAPA